MLEWYYDEHAKNLNSASSARYQIPILKAFFGDTPAHEIDPARQAAYAAHRRATGMKNDTINREMSVLSAALNRAYAWKFIPQPYKILMLPKSDPKERFLSRNEAATLYRYLLNKIRNTKRYHHLLLFTRIALNTGARSGVILSLTWDRVDFERKTIWFPVPGRKQTNKRAAVISFDHKLETALIAAKKRARTNNVIEFEGRPVKLVRRALTRACKDAGLNDVSPHTFRHTFATWAAMGGAPLYILGGALGHSNPSTTARYAKYQPEAFKDVIRASRKKHRA
ncbi:MAG: site-specific integrase [Asticcacaulis sp.]